MNKELAIEYEVFEEEGEVVLSVVDKEKDEVIKKTFDEIRELVDNFEKLALSLVND